MRRLGTFAVAGALLLGSALPAMAQQPPSFTVTFSGEMRIFGLAWDNMTDFVDTGGTSKLGTPRNNFKDSESYYFQRWRLVTNVETADKKARAVWGIEVGDLFWGRLGGASGGEYGGTGTRVGPSTGAELGADGVNVETKLLYTQFDIPFLPNANLLLGIHNLLFLTTPAGGFIDDDGAGIQLNWKLDPIDLQLYVVKASENNNQDADDNDLYAARLGVILAKDTRLTIEGLVANEQCFARRLVTVGTTAAAPTTAGAPVVAGPPTTAATGTCVDADIGDTFWIGGTFGTKIGPVNLDAAAVYGQRALYSSSLDKLLEEKGWGVQVIGRMPVGLVQTFWRAWYTTGDENRIAGGGCHTIPTPHPLCNPLSGPPSLAAAGTDFSTRAFSTNLRADSDKLPIPISGASWFTVPYVAEFLNGLPSLGAPGFGSTHYGDPSGTWGVGGSAIMPLSPQLAVGGGVAYVAASEDNGVYGDSAIEIDAGATYRLNANLTLAILAGYVLPDTGDDAWGVTFRTRFAF